MQAALPSLLDEMKLHLANLLSDVFTNHPFQLLSASNLTRSFAMSQVPIHGNYYGYYLKRPFTADPRLALLADDLFTGRRVLDVGCNEGWVTCEIGVSFRTAAAMQ